MAIRRILRFWQLLAVCAVYCHLFSNPASATEIIRLSADNADAPGTIISSDQNVRFEGKGSIRVSTKWPTTICLGQISGLNLENAKLVYQAKVKSEGLQGTVFLELWCHVGGGQYFSRGLNSTVSGTKNWQTISTAFILNKGQKAHTVTLNLVINGQGKVWIDDIQLAKNPLN